MQTYDLEAVSQMIDSSHSRFYGGASASNLSVGINLASKAIGDEFAVNSYPDVMATLKR